MTSAKCRTENPDEANVCIEFGAPTKSRCPDYGAAMPS